MPTNVPGRIQLGGEIKLGASADALTDYSAYISTLILHLSRESVDAAATYGMPRKTKRLGSRDDTVARLAIFARSAATDGGSGSPGWIDLRT